MAEPPDPGLLAPRFLKYPYRVGDAGVPATTTAEDHVRDLILQVLFTNPGERVNLPEFGVGLQRLVFAPNGDALRSSVQLLVTTNLNRWLGDRLQATEVSVSSQPGEEQVLEIDIAYTLKASREQRRLRVQL
jgi:uncharacterized protein